MDIEALREFCLTFPKATESLQWGDDLCFKVEGKLFVTIALDVDSRPRICLKCDPETFADLIEREGLAPAPYVGRYHWIGADDLDTLQHRELQDLLGRSYELVVQKLPKKKKIVASRPSKRLKAVEKPRQSKAKSSAAPHKVRKQRD